MSPQGVFHALIVHGGGGSRPPVCAGTLVYGAEFDIHIPSLMQHAYLEIDDA